MGTPRMRDVKEKIQLKFGKLDLSNEIKLAHSFRLLFLFTERYLVYKFLQKSESTRNVIVHKKAPILFEIPSSLVLYTVKGEFWISSLGSYFGTLPELWPPLKCVLVRLRDHLIERLLLAIKSPFLNYGFGRWSENWSIQRTCTPSPLSLCESKYLFLIKATFKACSIRRDLTFLLPRLPFKIVLEKKSRLAKMSW